MTSCLEDPFRDLHAYLLDTFPALETTLALSHQALIAYSSTNKVYGDLENPYHEEAPTSYQLPNHPEGLG